jgi:hypothetical protein
MERGNSELTRPQQLKKEQRRVPHRRRSAEPGQNEFCDQNSRKALKKIVAA